MAFPHTKEKYSRRSFFSPKDFIEYAKKIGQMPNFKVPESIIFCYQNVLEDYLPEKDGIEKVDFFISKLYLLKAHEEKIGVCTNFGIGPSGVVTLMEEFIFLGARRFISIGYAGGLQKDLNIGDIVVCTKAVRDEGVSYHYCRPGKFSYPSRKLTKKLEASLEKSGTRYFKGPSWTIDAPYRETVHELKKYQTEGIFTVEMEAAALSAVARLRKRDFAAAFVISDSLAGLVWNPQFDLPPVIKGLKKLYHAAAVTLSS